MYVILFVRLRQPCSQQSNLQGQTELISFDRNDEPVAPHQTTLLKLIDSYLHASNTGLEAPSSRQPGGESALLGLLTHTFLSLSSYAQRAIHRAIRDPEDVAADSRAPTGLPAPIPDSDPTGGDHDTEEELDCDLTIAPPPLLHELDLLLPKVCEALVLVAQSLTSIALREELRPTHRNSPVTDTDNANTNPPPKTLIACAVAADGQGLVENLVGTCFCSPPSLSRAVPPFTYPSHVEILRHRCDTHPLLFGSHACS